MSFTQATRPRFSSRIRDRGERYFREGRVEVLEGDALFLDAEVQGSRLYDVTVDLREPDRLGVSCTCPFFGKGSPCKHIWATLCQVDEEGLLRLPPGLQSRDLTLEETDDSERADPWASESELGWPGPTRGEPPPPIWQRMLNEVDVAPAAPRTTSFSHHEYLVYLLLPERMFHGRECALEVRHRKRKKNGDWGKLRPLRFTEQDLTTRFQPEDRRIIARLLGARKEYSFRSYGNEYDPVFEPATYSLPAYLLDELLPDLLRTRRCHLQLGDREPQEALAWDDGDPWTFVLKIEHDTANALYRATGALQRDGQERSLDSAAILFHVGWVFWTDQAARLDPGNAFPWIAALRRYRSVDIPEAAAGQLLERIYQGGIPRIQLPASLQVETVAGKPEGHLSILSSHPSPRRTVPAATVSFAYGSHRVDAMDPRPGLYDAASNRYLSRDLSAERQGLAALHAVPCRSLPRSPGDPTTIEFPNQDFSTIVPGLISQGWHIEMEGKRYRGCSGLEVQVSSGTDWFDLAGHGDFDGMQVGLPRLLEAAARGDGTVVLEDGSLGLLPADGLDTYQLVAGLGDADGDRIRFFSSQGGLLDALMTAQPEVTCDATFAALREQMGAFTGIESVPAPQSFRGVLRGYQEEGLGWMAFLRQFRIGGCLADDMGLGKTVQVLALLAGRAAESSHPTLVVVPRSIVFNWRREAESFVPHLRVLEYVGSGRRAWVPDIPSRNLILTTYGTLRRDIHLLKDIPFDYVILDEAQAIKNASTQASKAVRLLRADHRLALSGTPVENHLGELWSLFEFLNPGMLGTTRLFRGLESSLRDPDEATRSLLGRALRPVILRRTKKQVAKELPDKLEETLYCELDDVQRREYNQLRTHYRALLLHQVDQQGMNRSKLQILEALLRLRQAACHPGLIDGNIEAHPSAKLDVLMAQLEEVIEENHKVLVFSQFTKFLGIVRKRLDAEGVRYAYLDGRTRKREARVEAFRSDPDCPVFLISLKAGGLGLNLVEADYVYLLDPWWNPAVEAQAIDRAHRIGQRRTVFAYRLIARDTVEEKILTLQKDKRQLADAILTRDNSLIRTIEREDLELLLS